MSPSTYKLLTDALVLFHFTFVAFVVLGGLLALRWRWVAFLHLPAVVWVIYAEGTSTLCPLTPLENHLRDQAGMTTYQGGFVDHYIMPVLYPQGLTPQIQYSIAIGLLLLSSACYGLILVSWLLRRHKARHAQADGVQTTAAASERLLVQDLAAEATADNHVNPAVAPPAH